MKNKSRKNSKKEQKSKSIVKKYSFFAIVKPSPISDTESIPFDMDIECETDSDNNEIFNTTYDDIEIEAYNRLDSKYPESYFPKSELTDILISDSEKLYPVVSESDKNKIDELKKSKKYEKLLVLPDALYSLTPEMKLFLNMKESGLINDNAEFSYDKMHSLLNGIGNTDKDN